MPLTCAAPHFCAHVRLCCPEGSYRSERRRTRPLTLRCDEQRMPLPCAAPHCYGTRAAAAPKAAIALSAATRGRSRCVAPSKHAPT